MMNELVELFKQRATCSVGTLMLTQVACLIEGIIIGILFGMAGG